MDGIEHEICANCKKEIPHYNYVMHMAHCQRNITLCGICKDPIPKNQFDDHKRAGCSSPAKKLPPKARTPPLPPTRLESSQYFQGRKLMEDQKIAARKERQLQKYERLVDTGYSLSSSTNNNPTRSPNNDSVNGGGAKPKSPVVAAAVAQSTAATKPQQQNGLLACKFCDLELPKLELDEHENYCGARTDKCLECGELVMFKYKQIHMDSNHGFLKLKDEPGPRPSWDSTTHRSASQASVLTRPRPPPLRPFTGFDSTLYSFPSTTYSSSAASSPLNAANTNYNKERSESYKEISRRLDCKTEYIRNLLHDSASITVPLRHNGTVPRNHFNHNKGPAPQPPHRKRNPPTELQVPCEFCHTPIPHHELIEHESSCRPDLVGRFTTRRSLDDDDDDAENGYFMAHHNPHLPSSPDVELPCEFCADMIPASQLLRHQATCN